MCFLWREQMINTHLANNSRPVTNTPQWSYWKLSILKLWQLVWHALGTLSIARFMGTTCGRQDPGWPHVGPMNYAIWDVFPPYPVQNSHRKKCTPNVGTTLRSDEAPLPHSAVNKWFAVDGVHPAKIKFLFRFDLWYSIFNFYRMARYPRINHVNPRTPKRPQKGPQKAWKGPRLPKSSPGRISISTGLIFTIHNFREHSLITSLCKTES